MSEKIVVVAFRDDSKNSVAYREFESTEKAIKFYAEMLNKPEVKVISTRKFNRQ